MAQTLAVGSVKAVEFRDRKVSRQVAAADDGEAKKEADGSGQLVVVEEGNDEDGWE